MSGQQSRVGYYVEKRPHCGALFEPDAIGGANVEGQPPEAVVFLKMEKGRIADAGFQASGCGYLIACCSALMEMAIGRTKADCEQLDESQLTSHLGGLPLTKEYCAALAVLAMRNALAKLAPCSPNEEKAA